MRGRSRSEASSSLPIRSRRSCRSRVPPAIRANGSAGYQSALYRIRNIEPDGSKGPARTPALRVAHSVHETAVAGRFLGRDKLQVIKLAIFAIPRKQLVVGAFLNDPAVLDDDDPIGTANRGEPMRDDQGGAVLHQYFESLLHRMFGFGIE